MVTWDDWVAGERKQPNQFNDLQMFGKSILCPIEDNAVMLQFHWQYYVKGDGQRPAQQ